MKWLALGLPLLIACDRREPYTGELPETAAISSYHGLDGASSWIYRDDASKEAPIENQLLHAQNTGGLIELRRGPRWADAEYAGSLEWDTADGLDLVAWDLPSGASGATTIHFSDENFELPADCTLTVPEEGHQTYYGIYEDVLVYDCPEGLPGRYVFARDVGLIWLETSTDTLDLVAPW